MNHVDIAPNYAGTLMGITNMCANVTGFITPYVTGAIINDKVKKTFPTSKQSTCRWI